MIDLKSGFIPEVGETPILEVEAELWAESSNIFARILGAFFRIINLFLGVRRTGFVVLTNKRIVEISNNIICFCFVGNRNVRSIFLNSVKEVGYTRKATCGCFCPAYNLYYETYSVLSKTSVLLKGADEMEANSVVSTFVNTCLKASNMQAQENVVNMIAAPQKQAALPSDTSASVCPSCGASLEPGATFCGECGKKVEIKKNINPDFLA